MKDARGNEIEVGDIVVFSDLAVGLFSKLKVGEVVDVPKSGGMEKIEIVELNTGKKFIQSFNVERFVVLEKKSNVQ